MYKVKIKNAILKLLSPLMVGSRSHRVPLNKWHEPSGLNDSFSFPDNTLFSEYITATRKRIIAARGKAYGHGGRLTEKQLAGILPLDLAPSLEHSKDYPRSKTGILMIHGASDSPFSMVDLAHEFNARGFHVRSILVPGHSTVPGDLLRVKYEEWVKAAAYGVNSFDGISKLFIVGYSNGGTIALHQVLHPDNINKEISGLLLLVPFIKAKTNYAWAAGLHNIYSWLLPRKAWIDIENDEDFAKYESFPKNAGCQIYKLSKQIRSKAKDISVPVFMVSTEEDQTVDSSATLNFFKQLKNPGNKLIIYKAGRRSSDLSNIVYRDSKIEDKKILNFAHISIPFRPENSHYGAQGDYANCHHYRENRPLFDECKAGSRNLYLGEKPDPKLGADKIIRRLSFNPDFTWMSEQMVKFVSSN